jgi:hypothetical protein
MEIATGPFSDGTGTSQPHPSTDGGSITCFILIRNCFSFRRIRPKGKRHQQEIKDLPAAFNLDNRGRRCLYNSMAINRDETTMSIPGVIGFIPG